MHNARALANQERAAQAKRLMQMVKGLIVALATIMTFAMVVLLIADNLFRPDSFVINQVKIKGKFNYLSPQTVQGAVSEENLGNFFSIELSEIKNRVESLSWVKSADVRREWPHTLSVTVHEHKPVMRWRNIHSSNNKQHQHVGNNNKHGVEQWVSLGGHIVTLDTPLNKASPITLIGDEPNARELLMQAITWQKKLASSGLKVQEVSLSTSQSWRLTLTNNEPKNNFELLLGRDHADDRLARFQTLFDKHFKNTNKQLVRVDARYPDGLAVNAIEVPLNDIKSARQDLSSTSQTSQTFSQFNKRKSTTQA